MTVYQFIRKNILPITAVTSLVLMIGVGAYVANDLYKEAKEIRAVAQELRQLNNKLESMIKE